MFKTIFFILMSISVFQSCQNRTSESDPCDVLCDNCIGIDQCEECYEDCFNNR